MKPKKIKFKNNLCLIKEEVSHANSYNQAVDDFNKWLPNEEEIIKIITPLIVELFEIDDKDKLCSQGFIKVIEIFKKGIAKLISERLNETQ